MDYYTKIKTKLIDNEIYEKVKDYSKERNRVITYYEVGKLLYEAGSVYGEDIIGKYAEKLENDVKRTYNYRTLYRMRKFYTIFSNEILTPMVSKLSWSHYIQLISLKNINEIKYYIDISLQENLTKRQLIERIKRNEYERLDDKTKNKLKNNKEITVTDFIKNPIIIKNNNYEEITEKILQKLILENISSFMKELGVGFTYVDNEFKIKIGSSYNYIDLLLFNYIYNCFIVIELKITELKKEHIGQILTYMNYIDKNVKTINQDKTIGIIIVKRNNEFIMEYCSDNRIYAREFILN